MIQCTVGAPCSSSYVPPSAHDGLRYHATASVATDDLVGVRLTTEWLTVGRDTDEGRITAMNASMFTQSHRSSPGGLAFGDWSSDPSNTKLYKASGGTGWARMTVTGKAGSSPTAVSWPT